MIIPINNLAFSITATLTAQCALFIAIVFAGTILIGYILEKFIRLPTIAGHIIGGLIMGPSVLNIAQWAPFSTPFNIPFDQGIASLLPADIAMFFLSLLSSLFAISYLLWIAGYETDIQNMMNVGIPAIVGGILGALLPIITIVVAGYVGLLGAISGVSSIALGLIFAATSVSIPVAVLVAYKKMHLKSSQATLGAAVVDDIFAVILVSLFFMTLPRGILEMAHQTTETPSNLWLTLVGMALIFIMMFIVGRYAMPPIARWMIRTNQINLLVSSASCIMLFYFAGAELLGGLAGITGAYFAGLFHRQGDTHHAVIKQIEPFVKEILLPLFLASIGLQTNIRLLSASQWILVLILLTIAIITKLLGCYIATLIATTTSSLENRWTMLESYLFGSSMVARGEVGLVVATLLRSMHVIGQDLYVMSVVVIIFTTIATPIMLSIGFSYSE
jgi:Kef-type K+ transport system membrane component KefB